DARLRRECGRRTPGAEPDAQQAVWVWGEPPSDVLSSPRRCSCPTCVSCPAGGKGSNRREPKNPARSAARVARTHAGQDILPSRLLQEATFVALRHSLRSTSEEIREFDLAKPL